MPTRHLARLAVASALVFAAAAGCGEGDSSPVYTLEFAVTSSGSIGALQLEVEHLGDSGEFVGRGDKVDCEALVDAIVAGNAVGERTLKIGMISLAGIPAPAPILRCGFRTDEELDAESFDVSVIDASSTGGDPIDPPPTVQLIVSPQ